MCGHACPCSRPMTRVGVVKRYYDSENLLLVKVQQIGDRFIPVKPGATYYNKQVVTVRATADGWELA